MNYSKKRIIFDAVFVIGVFALTLYAVFHGQDLSLILTHIRSADLRFLFPGVICVILFICLESVVMHILLRSIEIPARMGRCCLYSFIGFFFSCITPSASGGQPAQLYYMHKDRLPVPQTTLVLFLITITYKMVLVVIGGLVLILRPAELMAALSPVMFWIYLGMGLNVIGIFGMILFVFRPKFVHWLLDTCLCLLEKLPIFPKKPNWHRKIDQLMIQYQSAADYYRTHLGVVAVAFVITVVQRFTLFAVTALTGLAFHLSWNTLLPIMILQCMVSVATDMLPLPGGMGINEKLFLIIFAPYFGELVLPAMVVSRGISYYSQLFISAAMTGVAHFTIRRDNK